MPRLIRTLALLGLGYAAVRYLSSSSPATEPQRRLSGPKAENQPHRTAAKARSGKARSPASRRAARS
ncbi:MULTISPECIES: hypothetical protein [Haematobacter]|uniref:hypothetical protein n=1 Tax=Haematobacter TaxID=366614 RepID=UPI00117AB4D0|nr:MULTISPECIES: hypothetical protein [Haematobacter]